jgi:hypothetical protein
MNGFEIALETTSGGESSKILGMSSRSDSCRVLGDLRETSTRYAGRSLDLYSRSKSTVVGSDDGSKRSE